MVNNGALKSRYQRSIYFWSSYYLFVLLWQVNCASTHRVRHLLGGLPVQYLGHIYQLVVKDIPAGWTQLPDDANVGPHRIQIKLRLNIYFYVHLLDVDVGENSKKTNIQIKLLYT